MKRLFWEGVSAGEYLLHHTNIYNILYRVPSPNEQYIVNMLFAGHGICYRRNEEHHNAGLYGVADPSHRTAVIANHGGAESETITAIHEFGHFYHVKDHSKEPASYPYSNDCMYGSNWENFNTLDSIVFCEGCRSDLLKNIILYSD